MAPAAGAGAARQKVSISCWALLFASTPPKPVQRPPKAEENGGVGGSSGRGGSGTGEGAPQPVGSRSSTRQFYTRSTSRDGFKLG